TQLNSGIGAGTYVLTVADANSCTRTASATVTEPPILAVTTTTTTNSATANPTGGTPAYTYLWSNAGNTKTITGLGFGTYTVTVTDKNGCLQTATATVVAICNVTLNGIKNITCNGACDGTAIALATGTAPYTFAWSGGQTTANATNLCAGSFTVSVTDANACVSTSAAAILQPPVLTATVSSTNAKCNTLGTASITASGGSAPYTYSWSPGGKTTSTISAGAGIYTVTLRDVNGCVKMFTDTVKSDPGAITSSASQTNISCNGGSNGSITITPSGGTAPYTYTWNPGGQTTSTTLTGLSLGTYIVTIADAIGCTSNRSFIITQPAPILFGGGAGLLAAPAKCNGESNGSINAPTSGGTSPYTYSWSNGATTQLNSGIGAGTYILTVTDGNGCTKTASATVSEPPVLVVTTTTATNTATANPVGGTTPYTYTWNNGANTKTITGLLSGTYTVTVTDKNGCSSSSTATILTTYINAANSESGLKIYPNPVSTYLTVELSFENNSAIKITLLNILGEIISDENLTASKTFKKSMDVSGLTDGIYFINIKSENQSYTQKFIINR
ncbi:MAG: T9SS type A sorting domain-containing protein, partial [Bacteroidia bacterium]|nr:T9SS type A sorting domain-containing protein [Bacteroidia bacterium]